MLQKVIKRWKFCSSKHFLDDRYTNLTLSSQNNVGSLGHISSIFGQLGIDLVHIKSKFSNVWNQNKKFKLDVSITRQSQEKVQQLRDKLSQHQVELEMNEHIEVPWFPRNKDELNLIGSNELTNNNTFGKQSSHFDDPEYLNRKKMISNVSKTYKMGGKIPNIDYTKQQTDLWKVIYHNLRQLHQNSMSERYLSQIQKMQKQFMMGQRIPQLQLLSSYLFHKTGFQIKPTHGLLTQRQFLNALAFRVFCCTQYLRHPSNPDYTPEPDIAHEVIGHVPMFADSDIAEISQQIGLMSLGATEKQIRKLATLYWYTLQFGVCKEGDKKKGYGAGIASSISELKHLTSLEAKFRKFQALIDCDQPFPVDGGLQDLYRVTQNFQEAIQDLGNYGFHIIKPMTTTYNFDKNCIEYDRSIEGKQSEDQPNK